MTSLQSARPARHAGLRRRTLSALGVALFLAGLLFGEAIEAVADVVLEEPTTIEVAAAPAPEPVLDSFTGTMVPQLRAERTQAIIDDLAARARVGLLDAVATLAPEGITQERRAVWERLADCESGDWYRGVPVVDSHRWDSTVGFFEGGLQFHPRTWDGFKDADMPAAAYDATPVQQMVVAERVLDAQGWKAWPVCSKKLGYR